MGRGGYNILEPKKIMRICINDKIVKKITVPTIICFCVWLVAILYTNFSKTNITDSVTFIVLITIQLISSVKDLYNRTIPLKLLSLIILLGLIYFFCVCDTDGLHKHFLGGFVAFLIMYLLNKLSKNQIGGGDLWLMAVTGLYAGIDAIFSLLFVCMLLAGGYALILLIIKKVDSSTEFPFAPFCLFATSIYFISIAC